MTKVFIAGFAGSMGQQAVNLVNSLPGFEITAGLAHTLNSQNPEDYQLPAAAKIFTNRADIPAGIADVWVDFTVPSAVYGNVKFAL